MPDHWRCSINICWANKWAKERWTRTRVHFGTICVKHVVKVTSLSPCHCCPWFYKWKNIMFHKRKSIVKPIQIKCNHWISRVHSPQSERSSSRSSCPWGLFPLTGLGPLQLWNLVEPAAWWGIVKSCPLNLRSTETRPHGCQEYLRVIEFQNQMQSVWSLNPTPSLNGWEHEVPERLNDPEITLVFPNPR